LRRAGLLQGPRAAAFIVTETITNSSTFPVQEMYDELIGTPTQKATDVSTVAFC
jgi:hypothetical protein